MTPLRIVHLLTHRDATRGGAIQALLLAKSQLVAGHSVLVFVNGSANDLLDSETFQDWIEDGIPIIGLELGESGIGHPLEALRFRRHVRDFRADVVHVHRDTALAFAWLALQGSSVPLVSQRGTTHEFRTALAAHVHRSKRVQRIIAVSQAVKRALTSYGVREDKIEVVYGSFDTSRFDPDYVARTQVRSELGLRDDQPLIVQVGEIQPKKGPLDFVRVAALVHRTRPDCVFALAGKGSHERQTAKLIDDLGLASTVRLLGFRKDVPEIYAAADIALNCSVKNEGLTGSLREALAMRKACVATRTDGNPEIVRHEETGLLVEPGDTEGMAQAVVRLLSNPELANRLGLAGGSVVRELMSESLRCARTDAIYRSVMKDSLATNLDDEREPVPISFAARGAFARPSNGYGPSPSAARSGHGGFGSRLAGFRTAHWRAAATAILLLLIVALPTLTTLEIRRAGSAVNNLLDDGVFALKELEDMLQNLIDLRAGVLEAAMENSDGRATKIAEVTRQLSSLRRNTLQLEKIDLEALSGAESEAEARDSITASEVEIDRFLHVVADPEMDQIELTRDAFSVSSVIDDAASELNRLTSVVNYRARIVDAAVPVHLARATYAALVLASLAAVGVAVAALGHLRRAR